MSSKIIIATPTRGQIESATTLSIVEAIQSYDSLVEFVPWKTTLIANGRAELVQEAMHRRGDYILFIDSDMTFPQDTIYSLLKHGQDVVAANYRRRHGTFDFTAMRDGKCVDSRGQRGLQLVDSIGLGVALINLEVFRAIAQPWFEYHGHYEGEDIAFCKRCFDSNIDITIDHDLSQQVGHITQTELRIDG